MFYQICTHFTSSKLVSSKETSFLTQLTSCKLIRWISGVTAHSPTGRVVLSSKGAGLARQVCKVGASDFKHAVVIRHPVSELPHCGMLLLCVLGCSLLGAGECQWISIIVVVVVVVVRKCTRGSSTSVQ